MVRYDTRAGGTEIGYELAPHLPDVEAIEDELTQVCINLALNAFDAMAANSPDQPRRLTIRSWAADDVVGVSFGDTGPGVPREIRDRVFQPFFTTKEARHGSGLGLAISYRILEQHRGLLHLVDRPAPGATFAFELPRKAAR
jgi:signal transduction histidine kinase